MNRIVAILVLSAACLLSSVAHAGPPTQFITSKIKEVRVELSKDGPSAKLSDREVDARLRDILDPVMEFKRLSQNALRSHWKGLSPEQQAEFVALFRALVFHSYLERIRSANEKYTMIYEDEEPKGRNAAAVTAISKTKSAEIELVFHLIRRPSKAWVVEDIVIDEVSLVENYREQFTRIITRDGFDALLQKMGKKLVKLGGEIPSEVKSLSSDGKPAKKSGKSKRSKKKKRR